MCLCHTNINGKKITKELQGTKESKNEVLLNKTFQLRMVIDPVVLNLLSVKVFFLSKGPMLLA